MLRLLAADDDTLAGPGRVCVKVRELESVGRFENATNYAEMIPDLFGLLHDLRGADRATEAALHQEPVIAYPSGQILAKHLRTEAGSDGIVYPSARRADGTCLAVFWPDLVQACGKPVSDGWRGGACPPPRSRVMKICRRVFDLRANSPHQNQPSSKESRTGIEAGISVATYFRPLIHASTMSDHSCIMCRRCTSYSALL